MASIPSLGQIAYEAYCQSLKGRSQVKDKLLPMWNKLPNASKTAWEYVAVKVINTSKLRE